MKKKSNNSSKKTNKLIKIINYILLIIMCLGSFSLMIYRVSQGRFGRVPTDIAIYFVLLIPVILKRFIKIQSPFWTLWKFGFSIYSPLEAERKFAAFFK